VRSLVTGGNGFVGRYVVERLVQAGDEVHATTLDGAAGGRTAEAERPADEPARAALEAATWHRADLLDRDALARASAAARPERVFHLAGFSSGARAGARATEALRVNAQGTLHLLEVLGGTADPGPTIVVAGSADVYEARSDAPLDEDMPLGPRSAYGASKAAQEIVALAVGRSGAMDVRVARLFPLVGPGQADTFVVPSFCDQAARIAAGSAEPVMSVGNLDVERDFTDVRDGAEALVRLAEIDTPRHRTYNVCSGEAVRIGDVLGWILAEAGIDPAVRTDPERLRTGDPPRVVGSPGRLRAETGWRVERDVREAVTDTYRWVASRTGLPAR